HRLRGRGRSSGPGADRSPRGRRGRLLCGGLGGGREAHRQYAPRPVRSGTRAQVAVAPAVDVVAPVSRPRSDRRRPRLDRTSLATASRGVMAVSLKPRLLARYGDIAWLLFKYGRSDLARAAGLETSAWWRASLPAPRIGCCGLSSPSPRARPTTSIASSSSWG